MATGADARAVLVQTSSDQSEHRSINTATQKMKESEVIPTFVFLKKKNDLEQGRVGMVFHGNFFF